MLEGIREHPIVCGAYTDGRGGICPMLAAHRHGSRVTLLAFARSWDAFARTRRVRRATPRELRTLEHLLVRQPRGSLRARAGDRGGSGEPARDPHPPAQRVAPIRSTSRSRCSGENGLVRNRSAPASCAPRSTTSPESPVSITIVALAVAGSLRSRRH